MKKLGSIACLVLAIALIPSPMAQAASPAPGVWSGTETKHWTGSNWVAYSQSVPFSFSVVKGSVLRFSTTSSYRWPRCTGGRAVSTKLPSIRRTSVLNGRFRGHRTTRVGSRKMTTHVSGRFGSVHSAGGSIVVKLAGCQTYRSVWKATSGSLGNIHIPMCQGQNILLADGTYYYNPCAYIAGRP
jgi:hypothetical protein